ncbi:kinesin K39 [Trypanosoma theileri]|uniref:Kinesin K39 n=1 Tax=Trypanosoma theileri TaxID=67003 RepID=A0A1X0P095_9TRYP|nr:kinesin K39 [Trypanosoma theileri]ORC89909.1 kinesin K39 [Trypanosoma theileri]
MSVNTSAIEINSSGLHTSSYPDGSYAFSVEEAIRSRTAPPPPSSASMNGGFSKLAVEGEADVGATSARTAAAEVTERDEEGERRGEEHQVRHRPNLQLLRGSDNSCEPYYNEQQQYFNGIQRRAPPTPVERTGNNRTSSIGRESTPARHAELRELLVTAERELAEVREEYSLRGAEIDKLRAELAREREVNRNSQIRYDDALQELREEHAEQTQRLLDQISVLKRLSENVMDEKAKLTEETAQRKQQLLALLERERDEKSHIMADYRQQTEALIAEQGREITSMRSTLQLSREEQERLQAERKELEEKIQTLEEQVTHLESTLTKERTEADKRLQEISQRHVRKIEELTAQNEEIAARTEREASKQQERRQELEDQLRSVGERLRVLEESHALEQQTLKETYRREVEGLREELQIGNAQREQLVEQHEKVKQKLLKNEEKVTQSLRQSVEQLRQEKETMAEEAVRQREEMQEKHWAKVNQLQTVIEGLRRQVADESAARKDAESERDLLTARADGLQGTVSRLAGELESLQVEHRTRERAAAAERESCVEELRGQLLERDGELAALRGELAQREESARRDLAAAAAELERVRAEGRRAAEGERDRAGRELATAAAELERLRAEIGQLHRDAAMREGAWQDELAEMRETHEEDVRRMDNVLHALRADLTRALASKTEGQKEMATAQREAQRQRAQLEDALALAEDARTKLQDDAHYREQLNNELQGTVRLLASKLAANEDDTRRLQEELTDVNTRLHDAHTLLGRKDAAIGQLNARLRAYEARSGSTSL